MTKTLPPLQEASLDIWSKKYCLRDTEGAAIDTCPEDTLDRTAIALAKSEKPHKRKLWAKRFREALNDGAIPAGRILSNAGAAAHKKAVSLINCTVSSTLEDSMEGILNTLTESGLTLKAGCGIGYEFSTLRPKGSTVHGVGSTTSGPLSFMDIYDKTCFTVSSAGGRRGAQMATFDVSHPDVLDFIKAKREDGRFRQFNLSLLITDEFIQAVKDNANWQLKWDGKPYGEAVPAQVLWDTIMRSNYEFAEPGFLLIDKINKFNNLWFCEHLRATNPCVTGDTLVAVAGRGPVPIKQLAEEGMDVPVYGYDFETGKTVVKYGRNPRRTGIGHKVYRVTLDDGSSFSGNAKHKVPLRDGSIVRIGDLVGGESLVPFVLKDDRYGTLVQTTGGYSKDYHLMLNCKYDTELDFGTGDWKAFTKECKAYNHKVVSVEYIGREDVYNLTVDDVHNYCIVTKSWKDKGITYWTGVLQKNCGEQPLPPYGACLLGSVNLTKFVTAPFTDKAEFNWTKYEATVSIFTRMLDNVVEISGLPLDQQRVELANKRRHGMGYLGLGSTMAMLGMRYGSAESIVFTEMVSKKLALTGFITGAALAKEKGEAPVLQDYYYEHELKEHFKYNSNFVKPTRSNGDSYLGRSLFLQSHYFDNWREDSEAKEVLKLLAKDGSRFTHHSSLAPTGTISLSLANNASNGIEPSFAHSYSRNIIREGRNTKEKVDVLSFEYLAYKAMQNPNATTEVATETLFPTDDRLPSSFATTDDLTPVNHVDIQAAAQQWIDSSISKTINVPTSIPFEDFKNIYMYAYSKGLKGCTTYRFNPESSQGVLVKDADLKGTVYKFNLEDGTSIELPGDTEVEYQGQLQTAGNLFDAIKENYFGKL